ncbi:fructose-bisphosphatase class II family protein [Plantibacter sp. YIM 135249]|uniref:fructose-bisphosphatase class II family protein n=1 Tax=Plantibacter sp. YIM 135249 TaxID=3423918 RepID=UPI003D3329A3
MAAELPSEALLAGFRRATEHAAAAAAPLVGSGDGMAIDGAAVEALRHWLDDLDVDGLVVVGEGEKDEAPMLFIGERFGTGGGMQIDLAVDPVDGTKLAATGRPDSVAVIAIAPRGALYDIGPAYYMEKLVTSAAGIGASLDAPLSETLDLLAAGTGRPVAELTVAVQDRPRNTGYANAAAAAGARVMLFADGDVALSLRAASIDGDIDLLIGIGGAPEGVLTAAAVRAFGGHMQGRLAPQSRAEGLRVEAAGFDTAELLELGKLCSDDAWLILSAVTDTRLSPTVTLLGARVDSAPDARPDADSNAAPDPAFDRAQHRDDSVRNADAGRAVLVDSVIVGPREVPVVSRNAIVPPAPSAGSLG